jgi:hypothetical protein
MDLQATLVLVALKTRIEGLLLRIPGVGRNGDNRNEHAITCRNSLAKLLRVDIVMSG